MARPVKTGLDYFPIDVDMDTDDKTELIEAKYGIEGFGVLIKLLMRIYRNGYYYEWGENEQLLFSKRVGVPINRVNEIINDAVGWELFDKNMLKKYKILTSRGIQKRYLKAVSRRQQVEIIKQYLLLNKNCLNEYINAVIVNINSINDDIGTQRKGEESKGEESKGKFKIPTVTEIKDYCKERNNDVDPNRFHDFYEAKGWMVGKNKMKDWKAAVRTWEGKDNKSVPLSDRKFD